MTLNNQDIDRLSKLARLELADKEKDKFRGQLSSILDYVAQIERLPTEGVPPTAHAARLENVVREDVVAASSPEIREDILKNAPHRQDDFFKVPPVFG